MNYDPWYAWIDPAGQLSERLTGMAREVLSRLPRSELAELQAVGVKISRPRPGNFLRLGESYWQRSTGFVIVAVKEEPEMSDAALAGILAHELAHARLGHCTKLNFFESRENFLQFCEAQAANLVNRWGFAREIKAASEYAEWRRRIIARNIDKFA